MTPLILVHGFMGGGAQWAAQEPLRADRDVIAVDLPGFGANAHLNPLESIAAYGAWVLEEATRHGLDRFHLLGHSMGGMVVQEAVRQAPDRVAKLILAGTGALGVLPGRFEPIETSMDRARADGPKATARRIAATWFLDYDNAAAYPACAAIAEKTQLPAMIACLGAMRDWSGEAHLPNIKSETLVIWGDKDRTYPWSQTERLWQTIPNAHLAVIPNAAHAIAMERPDAFNLAIREFLSGT